MFGAQNICRAISEVAAGTPRIVWPEALTDDRSRNAQELVLALCSHPGAADHGNDGERAPGGEPVLREAARGFEGSLRWLDANLQAALKALPPRDLSLFEVSLFCLVEHLTFRGTLSVEPYPELVAFCRDFGQRASAQKTT